MSEGTPRCAAPVALLSSRTHALLLERIEGHREQLAGARPAPGGSDAAGRAVSWAKVRGRSVTRHRTRRGRRLVVPERSRGTAHAFAAVTAGRDVHHGVTRQSSESDQLALRLRARSDCRERSPQNSLSTSRSNASALEVRLAAFAAAFGERQRRDLDVSVARDSNGREPFAR